MTGESDGEKLSEIFTCIFSIRAAESPKNQISL